MSKDSEFLEDDIGWIVPVAVILGLAAGVWLGGAPFGTWPEESFWTWLWKTGASVIVGAVVLGIGALILGFVLSLPLILLGERMARFGYAIAFCLGSAIWIAVPTAYTWAWLGHGTEWREKPYQWAMTEFPILSDVLHVVLGNEVSSNADKPKAVSAKVTQKQSVVPKTANDATSRLTAKQPAAPTAAVAQGPSLQETQDWIIRTMTNGKDGYRVDASGDGLEWSYSDFRLETSCFLTFRYREFVRDRKSKELKLDYEITVPVMDIDHVGEVDHWRQNETSIFERPKIETIKVEGTFWKDPSKSFSSAHVIGLHDKDVQDRLTKSFRHMQTLLADRCKATKEVF